MKYISFRVIYEGDKAIEDRFKSPSEFKVYKNLETLLKEIRKTAESPNNISFDVVKYLTNDGYINFNHNLKNGDKHISFCIDLKFDSTGNKHSDIYNKLKEIAESLVREDKINSILD